MSRVITATYDGGVFRPDQPPDLPPRARVRLIVEDLPAVAKTPEERQADWEEFEASLDEMTIDSGEPMPKRDDFYDRD